MRSIAIFLFAIFYPFAALLLRNAVLVQLFPKFFENNLPGFWFLLPPALYCFVPPVIAFSFLPLKDYKNDPNGTATKISISVLYIIIMAYPLMLVGWGSYCAFNPPCEVP